MATPPSPPDLARRLLDAQVRHHLDRLAGDALAETVRSLAESLLAAAADHQIADLVDSSVVEEVVVRSLATVPGSAAVSGFVELAVDVLHEGPAASHPLGEVVERERVEALVDEALALTPLLERALGRLSASPLVGTMAARFMGRIVGEVVAANQAVADKVPGLGSLTAFGTSAASKVMGVAGKQLEGLIGDTVGKGSALAVSRLNRILIETLEDPTTREAVLQIWDLAAAEQVEGLGGRVDREALTGVVDAAHELLINAARSEHAAALGRTLVAGFFERFGGYTPTELLVELEIERAAVVADLVRLAPGVVGALRESGDLERLLRAQLEPFYASDEVAALLE